MNFLINALKFFPILIYTKHRFRFLIFEIMIKKNVLSANKILTLKKILLFVVKNYKFFLAS